MTREPGVLYDTRKSVGKKKGYIGDCISIYKFQDGYILNKDGSIAVGFEISSFEEESKDGNGFTNIINEFSGALKRLPTATFVQKLDIYHEEDFHIDIPRDMSFFDRKALERLNDRKVLKHQSFIFVRFFARTMTPLSDFLNMGSIIYNLKFKDLDQKIALVESALEGFLSGMPRGLSLRRLDDEGHQHLLYQFVNMTFDRQPIGFESGLTAREDGVLGKYYLKSVKMRGQSKNVFDWSRNYLGIKGVTSPFMWPTSHFADFPHIISQQIEIINDQAFRKDKYKELTFVGVSSRKGMQSTLRDLS